jgi:hypothetical protein
MVRRVLAGSISLRAVVPAIALAVALASTATALAASRPTTRDIASTHTYMQATYRAMSAGVAAWPAVEANIRKLDAQLHGECPTAGVGAPQSDAEQTLAHEGLGGLWATAYRTEAEIVRTYIHTIGALTWSNSRITRDDRRLAQGLREIVALQVPPLCADIHAWSLAGFGAMPADVTTYVRYAEAINIAEIPRSLLAPYVRPADRALLKRMKHATTRFEELEFVHGQSDWIALLEAVGLPE